MGIKQIAQKVAMSGLAVSLVTSVFAGLPSKVSAAPSVTEITLSPDKMKKEWDGWGTALVWFGNATGGWSNEQAKNELVDALYSEEGLNYNIARYNIGGGDDPAHSHMREGGNMPGFSTGFDEKGNIQYNFADNPDKNQLWWLLAAKERLDARESKLITEAFSNSAPYYMTHSGCTSGHHDSWQSNLKQEHYKDFADYLAEVVDHYKTEHGITFDTLSPINEPNTNYWGAGGRQEGSHWAPWQQSWIIWEASEALKRKGLRDDVRISGMEESIIDTFLTNWNEYTDDTKNAIDQMNVHAYGGNKRYEVGQLAKKENKKLWMSEVDLGPGGIAHDHDNIEPALALADQIMVDIKWFEPQAWVLWQAIESEANMQADKENMNWGLIHADFNKEEWSYTKKYYAMAQFSKFIPQGSHFFENNDDKGRTLTAYNPEKDEVIVVYRNTEDHAQSLEFDVSKFSKVGNEVDVYTTSADKNLELSHTTVENNKLSAEVEAKSITTFVIKNAENLSVRVAYAPEAYPSSPVWNMVDGNSQTMYESNWKGEGYKSGDYIVLDLNEVKNDIGQLLYTPRQNGADYEKQNGRIKNFKIYTSDKNLDDLAWDGSREQLEEHFNYVAFGGIDVNKNDRQTITFQPQTARYVAIQVFKTGGGGSTVSIGDLSVKRSQKTSEEFGIEAIAKLVEKLESIYGSKNPYIQFKIKEYLEEIKGEDLQYLTEESVEHYSYKFNHAYEKYAEKNYSVNRIKNGQTWYDTDGEPIQAHGGGIIYDEKTKTYYWYGEDKTESNLGAGYVPMTGIHAYSSKDLYNWENEGIVLPVFNNPNLGDNTLDGANPSEVPMYIHEDDPTYMEAGEAFSFERQEQHYQNLDDPNFGISDDEKRFYNFTGNMKSPVNTLKKHNSRDQIDELNELYKNESLEEKQRLYRLFNWDKVVERPKVVYNAKHDNYVMWWHHDGPIAGKYWTASGGVAVSDSPTGPFKVLDIGRMPNDDWDNAWREGQGMLRDMTLYVDNDENNTGYLIYSSEGNNATIVLQLDDTYTKPAIGDNGKAIWAKAHKDNREAPTVFEQDGIYYSITSGLTGWNPNPAKYHTTENLLDWWWKDKGDPFWDDWKGTTHESQSTFVLPYRNSKGELVKDKFIFMADRWNPNNLTDSRYIWFPLHLDSANQRISMNWESEWNYSEFGVEEDVSVTSIAVTSEGNSSTITTKGGTLQLGATVLPENTTNKTVTWSVYEADGTTLTDKAMIDANGLLTAAKDGVVKVVATATDGSGVNGSKVITISGQSDTPDPDPVKVESIAVTSTVDAITIKGGTLQLGATVLPENATNKTVTWSVYEADGTTVTDKATIDANGLLTAVKDGEVQVVATAADGSGVNGSKVITISGQSDTPDPDPVKVESIAVTSTVDAITAKGGTLQLGATVLPEDATNKTVTWSVYEADGVTVTDKATIDANGLLTAVKYGVVKVAAAAADGSNVNGSKVITISGQSTSGGGNDGGGNNNGGNNGGGNNGGGNNGEGGNSGGTTVPTVGDPALYESKGSELTVDPAHNKVKAKLDAAAFMQKVQAFEQAGKNAGSVLRIAISGSYDGYEVAIPAEALSRLARSKPDAVIEVTSPLGSYAWPVSELVGKGLDANGQIIVRVEQADLTVQKGLEEKLTDRGIKARSAAVSFEAELKEKEATTELTPTGYVERKLIVNGVLSNPNEVTVMTYDPATGELRFVPAVFTVKDGKTVATIQHNKNGLYVIVEGKKTFADLQGHWAQQAVEALASKLIVKGKTEGTFDPIGRVTRAEFASLLVRSFGLSNKEVDQTFSDVAASKWYAADVSTAVKYGFVQGVGNDRFAPEALITREQMVVMMMNAIQFVQGTAGAGASQPTFADQDQISSYAQEAIAAAVDKGLIKGKAATTFAPKDMTTRAEAVVVLQNALQYLSFINK
ncbi:S-layer homology domain-containing protein [Paenibacillus sp. EC2-1]|uniref:S-layer homology domain-containing protein n=1 Tax=Paenibacillus sp. EC2-1 TaxID=3388665 RepID=UPI003BEF1A0E